jgi:hypothetical protein
MNDDDRIDISGDYVFIVPGGLLRSIAKPEEKPETPKTAAEAKHRREANRRLDTYLWEIQE